LALLAIVQSKVIVEWILNADSFFNFPLSYVCTLHFMDLSRTSAVDCF